MELVFLRNAALPQLLPRAYTTPSVEDLDRVREWYLSPLSRSVSGRNGNLELALDAIRPRWRCTNGKKVGVVVLTTDPILRDPSKGYGKLSHVLLEEPEATQERFRELRDRIERRDYRADAVTREHTMRTNPDLYGIVPRWNEVDENAAAIGLEPGDSKPRIATGNAEFERARYNGAAQARGRGVAFDLARGQGLYSVARLSRRPGRADLQAGVDVGLGVAVGGSPPRLWIHRAEPGELACSRSGAGERCLPATLQSVLLSFAR